MRKTSSGYLPTLDGWRAIAIILVLFDHDAVYPLPFHSGLWLQHHGGLGVDIFFAISGILICSRLLEEEQRAGTISLRNFYTRRVFRLFPAEFAYLAVIGILGSVHVLLVSKQEIVSCLLFLRNYPEVFHLTSIQNWYTSHFWSLSIEEHFYLLLPLLLVLVKTAKRRMACLLGCAAAIVAYRASLGQHYVQSHDAVRMDALLFPTFLAVYFRNSPVREKLARILRYWPIALVALIADVSVFHDRSLAATLPVTLLAPCLILGTVLHPSSLAGRLLESRPLRLIGVMSYSIYLWQSVFYTRAWTHVTPLGRFNEFPLNAIGTLLVAALSYYLIEVPFQKLGHRLAPNVPRIPSLAAKRVLNQIA